MLRLSPALLLALCLFSSPALAQDAEKKADLPALKDHEFNETIPTKFLGEMKSLKTASGQSFGVYQTGPKSAKAGLLMVHEWWGLNPHIKGTADAFGKLGYRVFAVDLYGGIAATKPKLARALMSGVKAEEAEAKLVTALDALAVGGRRIGTIGWCFGGGWSLRASLARPKLVEATCIYYGQTVNDPAQLAKLKGGRVLGIFAKLDGWITPAKVKVFDEALTKAGVEHVTRIFDADHAFANPSQKRFHRPSARTAWAATVKFFKTCLRAKKKG